MTFRATQIDLYLHHLAFQSRNPEHLAAFYRDVMDMPFMLKRGDEWHCEGPGRRMIIGPGNDKTMSYAGFACRDADGLNLLRGHIEKQGISILPSPSSYFESSAFSVPDPDGNLICFGKAKLDDRAWKNIRGPVQHLTFTSHDVEAFQDFYHEVLGFEVTDRVLHDDGRLATCFTTANHEHHTIACFKSDRRGVDHHSYEAGDWIYIRDWCDHFAEHDVQLIWGPGRHGPGNNLFVFIEDPDGNWIEISAELETMQGRPTKDWPQSERTLNLWGKAIMRS